MAILKNLSISGVPSNDTALQVNGSLYFQHLGSSSSHLQIFPDSVIVPNTQSGLTSFRNNIFSNATSLKFGTLASNPNINILIPSSSTESGILFKNTYSGNSTKILSSISSYYGSNVMGKISIETYSTDGKTKIVISARDSGSVVTFMEIKPEKNEIKKSLLFKESLKLISDTQYKTHIFGTRYTGSSPSSSSSWQDLFWPTIVYGSVIASGYSRYDYGFPHRSIYLSEEITSESFNTTTIERTLYPNSKPGFLALHGTSNTMINLYKSGSTTNRWEFIYSTSSSTWDNQSLRFRYNGSTKGFINPTSSGQMLSFTGQHRLASVEAVSSYDNKVGMIVVSSGTYNNMSSTNNEIDEALPVVQISTKRMQKNVIGVVSDKEDIESEERTYIFGYLGTVLPKQKTEEDTRLYINSVGEGGIWVTNINGNLENGDYITTCEIPGYGMKQDSEFLHNYTVAKITCDCDFDLQSPIYICEEFEWQGQVYKKAFVGCTYHCG